MRSMYAQKTRNNQKQNRECGDERILLYTAAHCGDTKDYAYRAHYDS